MKPTRNPFLRSNRPVIINPYSPQTRGLDHLWPLQGNHWNPISAAQVANDTSTPARTWSNHGSHFGFTNGNFLGSAQPVSFGRNTPISICLWTRAWSNGDNDSKILTLHENGQPQGTAWLHIDGDGQAAATGLAVGYQFGTTTTSTTGNPAFSFDGTWHHIAAIWNPDENVNGTMSLYINGIYRVNQGALAGTLDYTNTDIFIGYNHYLGDRRWEGDVSDIRIYGRVLSAKEIWQQYINPWDLYVRPRKVFGTVIEAADERVISPIIPLQQVQRSRDLY